MLCIAIIMDDAEVIAGANIFAGDNRVAKNLAGVAIILPVSPLGPQPFSVKLSSPHKAPSSVRHAASLRAARQKALVSQAARLLLLAANLRW